jgi:hypothetical protein
MKFRLLFIFAFAVVFFILSFCLSVLAAPFFTVRFDSQTPDAEVTVPAYVGADLYVRIYSASEGEADTLTTNDSVIFGYGTNWNQSTTMTRVAGTAGTNQYFTVHFAASNLPTAGAFFFQVLQTNSITSNVFVLGRGVLEVSRSPLTR